MVQSKWVCFFAFMERSGVTTILFDLGNVLFDLDIPATERALGRLLGEQTSRFKEMAGRQRFFERFETGHLSDREFIDHIQSHCLPGTTETDITTAWNAMLLGMPLERLNWLNELRNKYRVALLSNTNGLHIDWVRGYFRNEYGIESFEEEYLDQVYYSHEIGARKPGQEAFQYVLHDLRIPATDMLFIDDMPENTQAARSLGIPSIQHDPGLEIMEQLHGYIHSVTGSR